MSNTNAFIEPLLDPKYERLHFFSRTLKPDIMKLFDEHKAMHWVVSEINFSNDAADFAVIDTAHQRLIKLCLAFFASSDVLVSHLIKKHLQQCTWQEVQAYLANKDNREWEHSITYSKLITSLITDTAEQEHLLKAIETIEVVKKKAQLMVKYYHAGLGSRLIADACNEGISFSGLFCIIFYMKEQYGNKLHGLFESNDFICRDETNHRDMACLLYRNYIVNKLPAEEVRQRLISAVELEAEFMQEACPEALIDLNSGDLIRYIQFQADTIYNLLGYEGKIYDVDNPFGFMVKMSMTEKNDLFSGRMTTYSHAPSILANDPLRAHENQLLLQPL